MVRDTVTAAANQQGDSMTWRLLRRCYGYLLPYWPTTLGAYLATAAMNVLSVISPQLIRVAIDQGIDANDIAVLAW